MNVPMTDEEILAAYKPTKSKRRCAFCTSRSCYERVVTRDMLFDELACRRHREDLYRLSDIHLPGVGKMFISSTGYLERGNKVDFEEFKAEAQRLLSEATKMNDKLPNFYDVTIDAQQMTPKSGHVLGESFKRFEADVEAPDPQTAVEIVLRKHWDNDLMIFESEGDPGWVVAGNDDDDSDPWLEIPVEDYGDCATAVPYERRLLLAGARPLGFAQ